jgi:hypothetical protein
MKHQLYLCFLLALCASLLTSAQESFLKEKASQKPFLFADLPVKSTCIKAELEKVVHLKQSQFIELKLNDKLVLSGEILENVTTSSGVQNINVRISNLGNALLHVSILTKPDKTNKITGRIIHPKHGDALIISEENGRYIITKHKMEFFMVE